jgi:hypothetical protein
MPKPVAKHIADILKNYAIDPKDALWDCHGTWVMYHRYCEIIAAMAGVKFDAPQIVESSTAEKVAVICVMGHMGDRAEWSFGEAAPSNNKNAYPYAMAEKRAKDRVILKLVGLAGFVYSEEEADDFKESKPEAPKPIGNGSTKGSLRLFHPEGTAFAETVGQWLDIYEEASERFGIIPMWENNEATLASIQAKAAKEGRKDVVDRITKLHSAAKEAA